MNRTVRFLLRMCLLAGCALAAASSGFAQGTITLPGIGGFSIGLDLASAQNEWIRSDWGTPSIFPGDELGRPEDETAVMFANRLVLGKSADVVQFLFKSGRLYKIRVLFTRGNNGYTYFDRVYDDLKKILEKTYFMASQNLSQLSKGALWVFPAGETIYLGFTSPFDLILLFIDSSGKKDIPTKQPTSRSDLFPQ